MAQPGHPSLRSWRNQVPGSPTKGCQTASAPIHSIEFPGLALPCHSPMEQASNPLTLSSENSTGDSGGEASEDPPSPRYVPHFTAAYHPQPSLGFPNLLDHLHVERRHLPGRRLPSPQAQADRTPALDDPDLIGQPMGFLAGVGIGLLSLLVPLAAVVTDRRDQPLSSSRIGPPSLTTQLDGSQQPGRFTSPRPGQPAGGDSSR